MRHALKNITGHSGASARVVDGKLILSLPEAKNPIVWQMDLTQAKASALEVRTDEKNEIFTLTLKTPKGETVEIAPFEKRAQAVSGLMAASRALESAQGKIRPMEITTNEDGTVSLPPARQGTNGGKWIGAILVVLLIFVLINVWGSLSPNRVGTAGSTVSSATAPGGAAMDGDMNGVPMSADAFLQKQ